MLSVTPARGELTGTASYDGHESGTHRADGRRFVPEVFGATHWTLPLGTLVRVIDLATSRRIDVQVNDRGPPPWLGRLVDLSLGAPRTLGVTHRGLARVRVSVLRRLPAWPVKTGSNLGHPLSL